MPADCAAPGLVVRPGILGTRFPHDGEPLRAWRPAAPLSCRQGAMGLTLPFIPGTGKTKQIHGQRRQNEAERHHRHASAGRQGSRQRAKAGQKCGERESPDDLRLQNSSLWLHESQMTKSSPGSVTSPFLPANSRTARGLTDISFRYLAMSLQPAPTEPPQLRPRDRYPASPFVSEASSEAVRSPWLRSPAPC